MKTNLYEVQKLQKIAGLLKEDEFNLSDNPLKPFRNKKLVDEIIDLMVDDCIGNYDGDFETWQESLYSYLPDQISDALQHLETAIGDGDFDEFIESKIYPEVKARVNNYINEEEDFDLSTNPLSTKSRYGEFTIGDEVVHTFSYQGNEEAEFYVIEDVAKNYDEAKRKDPNGDWFYWDYGFSMDPRRFQELKQGVWYQVKNNQGQIRGWFPEDQLEKN
jgi:hypothetical protein